MKSVSPRGTLYKFCLYGEAVPERGARVGIEISQVEVYDRVREFVIFNI